jgi:hypothetical protein
MKATKTSDPKVLLKMTSTTLLRGTRVEALISSLQPPLPCTEKEALASVVENGLTKSQYINMKEEQKWTQ